MDEQEKEFLILTVKLLFQHIREGKVTFDSEKVPQVAQALEAVQFDDNGDPIFETIARPVQSVAKMVFTLERENIAQEAEERERNSPVHKFLDNATDVSDDILRHCAELGQFEPVAFELFKEAGTLLVVGASVHTGTGAVPGELVFPRNQAVCAGLLTRITKFMLAIMQLSATDERGEVVLALTRSIVESAINLRFLLLKNEARFYDQFVKFSLAPERELYDVILKKIRERDGQVLPMETRMLASIQRTCELSGVTIEEVSPRAGEWGGGYRNRLEALGMGDVYAPLQRIPSHAVHGTWVDLLHHHLESKPQGFATNPSWSSTDARILGSVPFVVLKALREYLRAFMGDLPELNPVYTRIDDLEVRLMKMLEAHEKWLQDLPTENNQA